jgi:hypothetical protein
MDNPETLATLDNQDTGHKTQKTKKISNTDPSIISTNVNLDLIHDCNGWYILYYCTCRYVSVEMTDVSCLS